MENSELMAGMEYDILSYWRSNAARFPVLSEIAQDVLAMQVSSVASESDFSTSGRMLSPHRSCLTHFMIEVLMCSAVDETRSEDRVKTAIKCKNS